MMISADFQNSLVQIDNVNAYVIVSSGKNIRIRHYKNNIKED